MKVLTSQAIRELEQRWAEATGLPTLLLMEHAATGCWKIIREQLCDGGVHVFAGPGNNGGDGLAIARLAALAGAETHVVLAADPARLPPDAAANLRAVVALGVPVRRVDERDAIVQPASGDVIVDALLGIGQREAPRGAVAEALEQMRAAAAIARCVAVDVPTGVNADTGALLVEPVAATATVTFHGLRRAHVLPPAAAACGAVHVVEIGLSDAWTADGTTRVFDAEAARAAYQRPGVAAHKGKRGHVLVIAGSDRLRGAAALAARGALCAGAGLVTVATTEAAATSLLGALPEAMWMAQTNVLATPLDAFDAIVIGPGLGRAEGTAELVGSVLARAGERPVVLDADALDAGVLRGHALHRHILTPHPGELARLLGRTLGEVLGDLPGAARDAASSFGTTVLAKTAGAWIEASDGSWWVPPGSPALGVGGSGDVLAGAIGALAATHRPEIACRLGAWLHQRAGALAAADVSEGTRASAFADALPRALAELHAR